MSGAVVLVPGLWMPAAAMTLLAARLRRQRYDVHVFSYRGRDSMERNVGELARYIRDRLAGQPVHCVGHSLGGMLVVETLASHRDIAVANVVLLGAPVRGCFTGRRFARLRLGRWMMGAARERWAEAEARWGRSEPLGVVAGTRALGLGQLLGGIEGANDGVVRVAETPLEGMTAQAQVPVSHSMLIASGRVGRLVERFLAAGRFE